MLQTVEDISVLKDAVAAFGWMGAAAAILIFIPQVIKIFKVKDASSLSKFAFGVNTLGAAMWTVFSATTGSYQGFVCNAFIIILLLVVFYFMYVRKKLYFYLWIVFVISVLVISIVLLIVVDHGDIPLSVNYVFVSIASIALAVAFIPQIRLVFIQKDFRAYSFATSLIIACNNVFWTVYWTGQGVLAQTGLLPSDQGYDSSLFPVYLIGAVSSLFQVFLQLSAAPLYFRSKFPVMKFVLSDFI